MIRCNFAILLAEQNLKITKVSKDTGISRTTLTSLATNSSQGIQFDTLNTICMYLKITPEQLISYVPSEISVLDVVVKESDDWCVAIKFDVEENSVKYSAELEATIIGTRTGGVSILVDLIPYDEADKSAIRLILLLRKIPRTFLTDLEYEIKRKFPVEANPCPEINICWNFDAV